MNRYQRNLLLTLGKGRCYECRGPSDKRLCPECLKYRATSRNDWRRERVKQGLCMDCGKPRGERGTTIRCRVCAERRNALRRVRSVASRKGPSRHSDASNAVQDYTPRLTCSATKYESHRCKYHGKGQTRCKAAAFLDWPYCVKHGSCKAAGCVNPKARGARDWCAAHRKHFTAEAERMRGSELKRTKLETADATPEPDAHSMAVALFAGRDPFR